MSLFTCNKKIFSTVLIIPSIYFSSQLHASSLYISANSAEQQTQLGESTVDFKPSGTNFSGSYDINDNFSLSAGFGRYNDKKNVNRLADSELDKTTFNIGAYYYLDGWVASVQYSNNKDEIEVLDKRSANNVYTEDLKVNATSISLGYGWDVSSMLNSTNWYLNVSSSLSRSDWTQDTLRLQAPNESGQLPPPQSGTDEGDNKNLDLNMSLSRYVSLSDSTGMSFGTSVALYHQLSGSASIVSRNGRNIQQVLNSNPQLGNQVRPLLNNLASSVNEEDYGMLTFYVSYDFTPAWSLDFDVSSSFAADSNVSSWAVTLGYSF